MLRNPHNLKDWGTIIARDLKTPNTSIDAVSETEFRPSPGVLQLHPFTLIPRFGVPYVSFDLT
jgi:hypothetical protein